MRLIDTGVASAEANMAQDKAWLEAMTPESEPILHFYEWERPSATFGYFVDPQDYLDLSKAQNRGLDLARRPTGGGIVFHLWDLAFSALIPAGHPGYSENTLDCYAFINRAVLKAVKHFLNAHSLPVLTRTDGEEIDIHCGRFCMARPTKYDVVLEGKKIAGAAQRKCRRGFLHQGTIALSLPNEEYLREILLPCTKVIEAMKLYTYPILGETKAPEELREAKNTLKKLLKSYLDEQ